MISFETWKLQNYQHINIIFNIIKNSLKKKNIIIIDEKKLYNDTIKLLYKNI